ncbi:MAG: mechanosensitive ion channel [Firmicutes bacterium]|nr:mechanosensitive ion channel [Bacillota bacterium]
MDLNFGSLNDLIISYGGKIILSIVVLILGLSIIKRIVKLVSNRFEKVGFDKSLRSFLLSLIKVSLQILLVITIASMLGVEMTSFIAIIGSAGLAVGLALQGSLSNFAGGVLILILKPFKAGDYIEASGHAGTVEEIQVFYTILNTPDNKRIIIPNANLSNSSTINYTANQKRRIDFTFSAGYDDDIKKVKAILNEIAKNHPLILDTPKPQVVLGEHGASSVNFYLRAWCETENYWNIYFELLEKVKLEFDKEGINIPYPQMDVHLNN